MGCKESNQNIIALDPHSVTYVQYRVRVQCKQNWEKLTPYNMITNKLI